MKRLVVVLVGAWIGLFATVEPAFAYLDPGTGSLILQVLAAGVAGVATVGKLYWSKLKSFLPGGADRSLTESPSGESPDTSSAGEPLP